MLRSLVFILLSFSLFGQTNLNIDLLGRWFDNSLMVNSTNVRYNDCWGLSVNGREYAAIGSTEGVHFIDLDGDLSELDFVPGFHQATTVVHRDIKTFGNFVYAVCDEGTSSLQIIDASYLPDSVHVVNELFDDFVNVHNVFIDTSNALLFSCSPLVDEAPLQLQRKLIVYSLADPENPVKVWQPDPTNFPYVHDCYVRDGIAYLNCGDDGMRVYDFSNPASPLFLQNITTYQDQGYNHQGWMTPDGEEFIFADETNGKRIKRCSVNNHQLTIDSYFGTNVSDGSIPHNIMLSNDFAYVAYYNEGLRIYDIRENGSPEVAHFDTYPDESAFKMEGAWGVFTELPSGKILVSDRTYGLFVLDFNEELFSTNNDQSVSVFPVPANGNGVTVKVNDPSPTNIQIKLIDLNGKLLMEESIQDRTYTVIPNSFEAGIYFLVVEYDDWKGEAHSERIRILFD
ncbi:MAG: choice-of-anchor B family protein [Crocinitomicaceae bacterium]